MCTFLMPTNRNLLGNFAFTIFLIFSENTLIFLNGVLIGTAVDPERVVRAVRDLRRYLVSLMSFLSCADFQKRSAL